MPAPNFDGRLKIASNRLPVSVVPKEEDGYEFKTSSGGLVSGLKGLSSATAEYTWYGWPGTEIPERDQEEVANRLRHEHNAEPVFLDQKLADRYYDGFSNSTVWPLFHYQLDKVSYDERTTTAYRDANQAFADTIAHNLKDGDLIWVQDYHLMLLPRLVKEHADRSGISVRVGFFLHTPFPNEDFFTTLPSKSEILEGVLASDVMAFHTEEYRRHFLAACFDILTLTSRDDKIRYAGRDVLVKTLPIGIEPADFMERLKKNEVQKIIRDTREHFSDRKLLVGIDRLDYIKGIPLKLHAMDEFLQQHPDQIGNVVLIQVVIPSRANLEANQQLRREVQELVGKINGKYGSLNYMPVHFLYKSLQPDELTALYAAANVCFICSTRDGLNLVCYEYVACHDHKDIGKTTPGVLVLSEFAGASTTLKGCITVNPWDKTRCAEGVARAVTMDSHEAAERLKQLRNTVDRQTSFQWALSFLLLLDGKELESVDRSFLPG